MSTWYTDGTASVASGTNVVYGTLTVWGAGIVPGNPISFDGGSKWYEIAALDATTPNTKLTLVKNFAETSITNGAYAIQRFNVAQAAGALAVQVLTSQNALIASQTDLIETNGPPNPALSPGNIANKSIAFDPTNRAYYHKVDGAWTGPFSMGGDKGWSPILAVVADGTRRVFQITDWTGGEGTKPATGSFIGATGIVGTAALAVDVRGATGAQGQGIQPNATGTFAQRSTYNASAQGFIYLSSNGDGASITTACLFIKNSATSGDWSAATALGTGGGGLLIANNLSDVANTTTARSNIYAAPFDALAYSGMQVNGSCDISEELGTTGATLASGTAKYIIDEGVAQYVHGAGTAVVTSAQIATALPGFSFGHQLKATTAISSPANGDYALHRRNIEGYRVARLGWGASGAQPIAYAAQFYSTVSGVAFVKVSNSDKSRCCYVEHTIAAGWNFITGSVPGDTAGTWQKTTSAGLIWEIFSAGKAASPVTPGAWSATNTTQTTNSTNLLGTANNLTILTGFIIVPGIELPSASRLPFIMRPSDEEIQRCWRYYKRPILNTANAIASGFAFTTTNALTVLPLMPRMRATPALALSAASDFAVYAANGGNIAATAVSLSGFSTADFARVDVTVAANLVAGNATLLLTNGVAGLLAFNARMTA